MKPLYLLNGIFYFSDTFWHGLWLYLDVQIYDRQVMVGRAMCIKLK